MGDVLIRPVLLNIVIGLYAKIPHRSDTNSNHGSDGPLHSTLLPSPILLTPPSPVASLARTRHCCCPLEATMISRRPVTCTYVCMRKKEGRAVKGLSSQFGGQRNRPSHTGAIKGPPKGCYTRLILHYWAVVHSKIRLC